MGAELAFYGVLSLAPLVILVVGICALAFGTAGAQAQLLEQFRAMVGGEGAHAIEAGDWSFGKLLRARNIASRCFGRFH